MSLTIVGPDGRAPERRRPADPAGPEPGAIQRGEGRLPASEVVDRALELFVYALMAYRAAAQDRFARDAQAHYGLLDPRDEPPKAPRLQVDGEEGA